MYPYPLYYAFAAALITHTFPVEILLCNKCISPLDRSLCIPVKMKQTQTQTLLLMLIE